MNTIRQIALLLLILSFTAILGAEAPKVPVPEPFGPPENRVVVILDASGSFKSRMTTAIENTASLLEGIAKSKLHRWESGGEIVLISLDAMPEVIWRGSLKDLKAVDPDTWRKRFLARNDYAQCTDVELALQLALQALNDGSKRVRKYLFVFSDLVHEPPLPETMARSSGIVPPSGFSADFPWNDFKDVSVSCFWVPADKKYLWTKTIRQHGVESNFKFFTVSDSPAVEIAPPPQPVLEISAEKRNEIKEATVSIARKASQTGVSVLIWTGVWLLKILATLLAVFTLLVSVGLVVRSVRGRRPSPNDPPALSHRRPEMTPANPRLVPRPNVLPLRSFDHPSPRDRR